MKKLTPAQQQYMDMKRQHPDCVLLFRLGDFYEVFYDDAHIAHKILGITLTARDKQAENPIPMAGIPHHALEKYLPTLVTAGYKVAIADQVGEVVPGKLVERKITQIITPGTWVEQGSLAAHIVALVQHQDNWSLAWGDVTLGVRTTKLCATREEALESILRISPRELICDGSIREIGYIEHRVHDHLSSVVSSIPIVQNPQDFLLHVLEVHSLESYGTALESGRKEACASIFRYIQSIHQPLCVRRIEGWQQSGSLLLDQLTIKNLEIFQGSYQGSKKQSLFGVINSCTSSMGSRFLAHILSHPTQDKEYLSFMQRHITLRYEHYKDAKILHEACKLLGDIPRIAQQITQKKRLIATLRQLSEQIGQFHQNSTVVHALSKYNEQLYSSVSQYVNDIKSSLQEEIIDENDWLADGWDIEIDRLRHIDQEVDAKLVAYQQSWVESTGVSVKIKHITNQGYFLEVTPKDINKFEAGIVSGDPSYGAIRAQTLKTGQRYTSSYLQELQSEIYAAKENLASRHRELAEEFFTRWEKIVASIYLYADMVAQIDVYTSMALLMHEKEWCLPDFTSGTVLHIEGGRHPVVEEYLSQEDQFIPNDTVCTEDSFFHIITGPNMGGKSTYMRQQALIVLLAHAGLPVPAKKVSMPYMDGIFARIGSGDVLAKQQSTFMTEMIETASILHNATAHSFIVLDELGRGTSTTDGLALARAISVYICRYIKAKTLFATHYHELIDLEGMIDGVENWHVGVYENDHEVVFFKKICRGGADKSYGIDVAKLAGIPREVISLAEEYITQSPESPVKQSFSVNQSSLFSDVTSVFHKQFEELSFTYGSLDINTMTPLDALQVLQEIVIKLRK